MAEIAKALGMEEDDVSYALDAIQDPVSLFEPIFHDGSDAIYVMDQVKDSTESEEKWLSGIAISEGLNKLNDREQRILRMRFLDGRTQMEVANEIGLSQSEMQFSFPGAGEGQSLCIRRCCTPCFEGVPNRPYSCLKPPFPPAKPACGANQTKPRKHPRFCACRIKTCFDFGT